MGDNFSVIPLIAKNGIATHLFKVKVMQSHCSYFIMYHWEWSRFLGNDFSWCWVDRRWLRITEQRGNSTGVAIFGQHRYLAFGPLVLTLIFPWRYRLGIFIWGDGLLKLLKLITTDVNVFKKIVVLRLISDLKGPYYLSWMFKFTLECRIWISLVRLIDLYVLNRRCSGCRNFKTELTGKMTFWPSRK
jgi:hypothetical protein